MTDTEYSTVLWYGAEEFDTENDLAIFFKEKDITISLRNKDKVISESLPINMFWNHICWIWHRTTGWEIYVNGTFGSSGTSDSDEYKKEFKNTRGYFVLGQDKDKDSSGQELINNPDQMFPGKLTEVYVYHTRLATEEVLSVYQHLPPKKNMVIGWWKFKGQTKGSDIVEIKYPF